jgi:hypothetical protein
VHAESLAGILRAVALRHTDVGKEGPIVRRCTSTWASYKMGRPHFVR